MRQKVIDAGAELLQSSPQEMADYMRKEAAKWAEVIRAANIQIDYLGGVRGRPPQILSGMVWKQM